MRSSQTVMQIEMSIFLMMVSYSKYVRTMPKIICLWLYILCWWTFEWKVSSAINNVFFRAYCQELEKELGEMLLGSGKHVVVNHVSITYEAVTSLGRSSQLFMPLVDTLFSQQCTDIKAQHLPQGRILFLCLCMWWRCIILDNVYFYWHYVYNDAAPTERT